MKTFFKVVAWIAAAFVGLFIWNVTPDFRPLIAWVLAAAFLCYVLSTIVEVTVKRLIWDELMELRSRLWQTKLLRSMSRHLILSPV